MERAARHALGAVHVLVGDDVLAIDRVFAAVKAAYLTPDTQDFNLEVICVDNDTITAAHIISAAETMPFLGGTRVVWVKHADALAASELEVLADHLETAAGREDLVLILVCAELDKRTRFAKAVYGAGIAVDCSAAPVRDVAGLVRERYGKRLSPRAAQMLEERLEGEPGTAGQEIEKLCLFAGDREELTEDDVLNVCIDAAQRNEWAVADYLLHGNAGEALGVLREMRRNAQDAIYQHTIVASALSRLPAARAALLDGSLHERWREFRIGRGQGQAALERRLRSLNDRTLAAGLRWLMYTDIAVKGSALPADVLTDLACLLAARGGKP